MILWGHYVWEQLPNPEMVPCDLKVSVRIMLFQSISNFMS